MILTDKEILKQIELKTIVFEPFDRNCLGSNSYDVHLGEYLGVYNDAVLDAKKHNEILLFKISKEGFKLMPGILYLGSTLEYTETHNHVPFLDGKSSTGRLGIDIHATAGKGDIGFCNHWTLEISVKQPVIVYPGMPIGQVIFFEVSGELETSYKNKKNAKYNNRNSMPVESMMFKNFK